MTLDAVITWCTDGTMSYSKDGEVVLHPRHASGGQRLLGADQILPTHPPSAILLRRLPKNC